MTLKFEFRYPTEQFAFVHVSGDMTIEQGVQCKALLDAKFMASQSQPSQTPGPNPDPNSQSQNIETGNPAICDWCNGTNIWDNRPKKESGAHKHNAPDYRCGNKACGSGLWLGNDGWSKPKPKQVDSPGNGADMGDGHTGDSSVPF